MARITGAVVETSDTEKVVKIYLSDEEAYSDLQEAFSKLEEYTTSCEPKEGEKACFILEIDDWTITFILLER